ncbi:FkbM family methyltransferase [Roseibium sp. MMSF_3544]|uniref:FkbM family methyltransferase n=1 Tax=unclassified Roseibium TaxID=2629323 RepID=UPI00273D7242|nr:FkbM family methyltransferase [Roseibium sp. MMSF_3544]
MRRAIEKCEGMACIDLGANVGELSEMMAAKAGRVYAFEPDPWACQKLTERVRTLENVEIIQAAAGLEDGHITLYRHENFDADPLINSQSSSVFVSKSNVASEAAYEVRQIDFLRFLRETEEEIGVLKIDIEGAEVALLEALFDAPQLFKRVRYVFAETHEKKIPGQAEQVSRLKARARYTRRPVVNLFWH